MNGSQRLQINGNISYNGKTLKDFVPQRTAAYVEQTDLHLAQLTVRETMDFAACVQGTGHKAGRSPVIDLSSPGLLACKNQDMVSLTQPQAWMWT